MKKLTKKQAGVKIEKMIAEYQQQFGAILLLFANQYAEIMSNIEEDNPFMTDKD